MGMATTLYAIAHDKFWYTFAIVACASSNASTTCQQLRKNETRKT